MKNRHSAYRRRFTRIRRRKKSLLIRNVLISLIAVLALALSIALAYWMDNPAKVDFASSFGASQHSSWATYETAHQTETSYTELTTDTANSATDATSSAPDTTVSKMATIKVGDEYFDDACFIGDSRTQGLMLYSAPEKATFLALKGMTVSGYFSEKGFEKKTKTAEDMIKKHKYGKVYVMLGLNELGWTSVDAFIKRYGELIDSVKKHQPNAKIFIQSILPVSAAKSKSHKSFNNPRVNKYNKLIFDLCVKKQVIYLNVREAVEDKNGCLPKDATTDGIHMNKKYCDMWINYLRTHTDVPVAAATTTLATSAHTSTANAKTEPSQ